jgi:glycosyltransferase 2 family protein
MVRFPGEECRAAGADLNMRSSSPSRRWYSALAVLLAAVLFYVSLRGVDWGNVWRIASGADWSYVAGGTAFSCGGLFLRSLRWRILLNAEARLSVGTVFWANMAGYLGNNFLPARAGEVVRTVLISRQAPVSRTYVFTTAISERLVDVVAVVTGASVALATVTPQPPWMTRVWPLMAAGAAAVVIAMAVLPRFETLLGELVRAHAPAILRQRLLELLEQVLLGLRTFHHGGRLAGFVVFTGCIWGADLCATVIGARALGFTVSFPVAMLLITGLGLGTALPSTPGYVGIYQFIYVSVLTLFGVARDAAMAFALFSQCAGYLLTLLLGVPGLWVLEGAGPIRVLWSPADRANLSAPGDLPG